MARVYIVSTGRTGTMTLAHYYGKVPGLAAGHETLKHVRKLSNWRWDGVIDEFECRLRLRQVLSVLPDPHVESNCLLWNLIDLIAKEEPDAGFIWIVREPQACIRSLYHTGFGNPRGEAGQGLRPQTVFHDRFAEDYDKQKMMENCIIGYRVRNTCIEEALSALDPSRWMLVHFEAMFSNMRPLNDFVQHITGRVPGIIDMPHENIQGPNQYHHPNDAYLASMINKQPELWRWHRMQAPTSVACPTSTVGSAT